MNVYTCDICRSVNSAHRINCQNCGTIPAQYSIIGRPMILNEWTQPIEVTSAHGCERLESRRAHKAYFRTVKLDYYAEASPLIETKSVKG